MTDDLVIEGRIWRPGGGAPPGFVMLRGGRVEQIGDGDASRGARRLRLPASSVILPGLVDLHTHPAISGSRFGVPPDPLLLPQGVHWTLSQGDAGAAGAADYIEETVRGSQVGIKLAINLGRRGETSSGGCLADPADLDAGACRRAIAQHPEEIWGIAVNASHHACGRTDPREVLRAGLAVAGETGLPLLYGMRRPEDWPLAEQLQQLRPGDVVTYCFRQQPHCIVDHRGVLPEVRAARERGIRFDVGHGRGSFSFAVAEAAIADGFLPDTISTDLQRGHLAAAPRHTLPLVMSKLAAAGMPTDAIFRAVTQRPAEILGLPGPYAVTAGGPANFVVLDWEPDPQPLSDTEGGRRLAGRWRTAFSFHQGRRIAAA